MSLERDAANHFDVCPGAGRSGGGIEARNRRGRGRERRVVLLALVFAYPGPIPWGVRSGVAVRGKRRHDALGLPSAARGLFVVAWQARLDGTVASGRVELDLAVTRTAFAGLFDVFREPFGGVPGAVHVLY